MKTKQFYQNLITRVSKQEWLPLLLIRLTLAYGFYGTARMKWKDIEGVGQWFAGMHYPLPQFSAYLAATTETLGVILLLVGLGSRLISIPLIIVMLVAIFTVHLGNGFNAGDNGFEIPLYYSLLLMILLVRGSGILSIDYLLARRK